MRRLSRGCKFADPDSAVSAASPHRVRPDTMSCGSDGCRDGSSGGGGSGEFRRTQRPSKVAADDSVESARCSDAAASPASWIDRKLLVDPKMMFVGSKIGEGAHGKVYKGKYVIRL